MQSVKRKLQSQRGASISFALLLFLVCAVISSVVIVSATTSAGRMSQTAEMDQRYYAVTSAAKFLQDMVETQPVTVTTVTTTREERIETIILPSVDSGEEPQASVEEKPKGAQKVHTIQYAQMEPIEIVETEGYWPVEDAENGGEVDLDIPASGDDDDINPSQSDPTGYPMLVDAACMRMGIVPEKTILTSRTLTLSANADNSGDDDGLDTAALTIDVDEKLNSDGTIILTLSNASPRYGYTLRLTFTASETINPSPTPSPPQTTVIPGTGPSGEIIQTTVTTREYTVDRTLNWKLTGFERL